MKLTIQQKKLNRALRFVERVLSKNNNLPILSYICLKTENGRLKISGTNLEIGVTCSVGAKIEETGEIAVPGRIFAEFIHSLSEDTVTLTAKSNSLFINSERYKTQILGNDAKDFPIIPRIKTDPVGVISTQTLARACAVTFDSIAISETRPELSGLYLEIQGRKAVFAATDSFRLAEQRVVLKSGDEKNVVILPRNTVAELARISADAEGDFEVRIGDNQISFTHEDVMVVSRLIDGHYPDYAKVIPEKSISRALVVREEFEKKIRLAGLFSSNVADIVLSCADGKIHITAKNAERGEIKAAVDAVVKNDPFEVSLNFNYLLDGLKAIQESNVIIEFSGAGSPLVLRPGTQSEAVTYLIMPLRS